MPNRFTLILLLIVASAQAESLGIYDPRHGYETRPPQDRFTRFVAQWQDRQVTLDESGELPFLRSLLAALKVPVSSQMLVFTATSLQKGRISARNPRALYFNDDTYVGFVPGGRFEVISIDPEIGGIFYIFDRPPTGRTPVVERSLDCMNCHAPRYLENIPALIVESVVPSFTGGGEKAFRRQQSGHGIPLGERFGGWHLTGGGPQLPHHWGNLIIKREDGVAHEIANPPGARFDLTSYPRPTSDLLAQLLHEHQVGFVNRAFLASYRYHALAFTGPVPPTMLAQLAQPLVRYMLFADEIPLPQGTIGDSPFMADFLAAAPRDPTGRSLRDLDGRTRLLRHRCSYMIYSPAFIGLPAPLRMQVLCALAAALEGETPDSYHLPTAEKGAIIAVLERTLPEFAVAKGRADGTR
jgi:hypothetical protein